MKRNKQESRGRCDLANPPSLPPQHTPTPPSKFCRPCSQLRGRGAAAFWCKARPPRRFRPHRAGGGPLVLMQRRCSPDRNRVRATKTFPGPTAYQRQPPRGALRPAVLEGGWAVALEPFRFSSRGLLTAPAKKSQGPVLQSGVASWKWGLLFFGMPSFSSVLIS